MQDKVNWKSRKRANLRSYEFLKDQKCPNYFKGKILEGKYSPRRAVVLVI